MCGVGTDIDSAVGWRSGIAEAGRGGEERRRRDIGCRVISASEYE
jgi:hypothetical protein